jgi:hypothetical protein
VDAVETGERLSGQIRPTLQVPDLDGMAPVHPPVLAPRGGDRNARLQDPDGLQVTLFEV